MRIAVAGFMHESNTFNPLVTDLAAFQAQAWHEGPALLENWRAAHHEVGGFLEGLQRQAVEAVPLVMAWATPSGPVRSDVVDKVVAILKSGLEREKPDALLLALHGAMVTDGDPDGDGGVLERLRQAVGPALPIVVTLDLHGNISERVIANSTAAIAYRTNPHMDQRARGLQAAELIVRIVKGEVKPVQALAKPPLIVNIMVQDSSRDPLHGIMAEARRIEQIPGILAVSFLPGFAYADVPQMGPAVIVVADNDANLARSEADRLGALVWDKRQEMNAHLLDAAEAVARAQAALDTPVVLVDTGDNVGGGSAGDGTVILAELLRQKATESVVCLYAPEEVKQCHASGVGHVVDLVVGGKVDKLHGDPVSVTGKVRLMHDGHYVEPQARHGGRRFNSMGLTAVVELPGSNLLVLNSERHPPFSLGQLTCLGIDPRQKRILVVKAAIAYRAAYLPVAGTIIEVDTPGVTAVNPHRLKYRHIRRPMYPLAE